MSRKRRAAIHSWLRQRYIAARYALHHDHDPAYWCGSQFCTVARDLARRMNR